jgi:hypothetical protein
MSRRKPLAALAAVAGALALVVPAASANAATTAPTARTAFVAFGPDSLYCRVVYSELVVAGDTGNMPLTNFLSNVFVDSGCGGAAI